MRLQTVGVPIYRDDCVPIEELPGESLYAARLRGEALEPKRKRV